jgi:hypothetical protein
VGFASSNIAVVRDADQPTLRLAVAEFIGLTESYAGLAGWHTLPNASEFGGRCDLPGLIIGLKALAVMLLAAFAAVQLHFAIFERPDSFAVGIGVFLLIGALLLYQIWFWRKP